MKKLSILAFLILMAVVFSSCLTDSEDEEWSAAKVCPESKRGTFTDERDGRVYKYTTIGKQVWMAENLNYKVADATCMFDYDDCASLGRHYSSKLVKDGNLCPSGWHVASLKEWETLKKNVGGEKIAGLRLKATSGWLALNPGEEANGLDACGFSAMPAPRLKAVHYGYDAVFKTSTVACDGQPCDSTTTYAEYMESNQTHVKQSVNGEPLVLRCLKD